LRLRGAGLTRARVVQPPTYWNLMIDPFAPTDKLTVKVISAHYLPKPLGSNVDRSEIIDPFVEMHMSGVEEDMDDSKRTKVITDNGFNPIWNESFDFMVRVPDLATMLFVIKDKDVFSEGLIAQTALPLRLCRPGFRVLPLRHADGRPIMHAFLFCLFAWKRV
jgi:Ca2+-dependent lipid-binding protein